jgi:FAD/FMN-containing dehydrogenase
MNLQSSEKLGAGTPWIAINQLLAPDERFEVHDLSWKGYLLAPKQTAQLVALLYLLRQASLPFCVQGRGTWLKPGPHQLLIVSMRAFSQVVFHSPGLCEVGAGCSISQLHHALAECEQEKGLEGDPLASTKRSIGGVFLSGHIGGLQLRRESPVEALLGVEWVSWEGNQVKEGSCLRSVLAGPTWYK